ncbi:hypothetical protein [Stratiformator vulcanicus]|uniref:Uncharacterized protein n=1 Tax=Stratiformator vulcanicus TaxID=2527980 RepID=A0A517QZY9_9PLAN|nr:hypothetical protein [Stratiformator vulcanicus]QDT37216.1 hypothetical protein Pan189_15880 [Stratiformator vulcanicus]
MSIRLADHTPRVRISTLTGLLLAVACSSLGNGAEVEVEVGFAGKFKVGQWMPLRVADIPDEAAAVRVTVLDADGAKVRREFARGDSSSGDFRTTVQAGRSGSPVTIELLDSNGVVIEERTIRPEDGSGANLLASDLLVVSVDSKPVETLDAELVAQSTVVAADVASADLPKVALAYSAVDAVLMSSNLVVDSAAGPLTTPQRDALLTYIEQGGHLIMSISAAEEFRRSEFAEAIPIQVEQTLRVRNLSPLESFADSRQRIRFFGRIEGAAGFDRESGTIVVDSIDGPLVMTAPLGFGRITLLAVDHNKPPLSTWKGRDALIGRLVAIGDPQVVQAAGNVTAIRVRGISELITQLDLGLGAIEGVRKISRNVLLLIVLAYLAIIGPLDYLLIHRLFHRPYLTWITFPVLAIATAAFAGGTAEATNRKEPALRSVELIALDSESNTIQGESMTCYYSPRTMRCGVTIEAVRPWGESGNSVLPVDVGWFAAPEDSFGGANRAGGGGLLTPGYQFGGTAKQRTIERWPVPMWGTRKFRAEWSATLARSPIQSELESVGVGRLAGTLSHTFDGPLSEVLIAYGNRVFRPTADGEGNVQLEAATDWDIGGDKTTRYDLGRFLTRAKKSVTTSRGGKFGDEVSYARTAYDPNSGDLDRIAITMALYQAAGGEGYTGLKNFAVNSFDLSGRLDREHAVLVAKLPKPVVRTTVQLTSAEDGSEGSEGDVTSNAEIDQHSDSYLAVLLPVRRGYSERTSLPPVIEN